MTGNNINHPNDYLARVYAQTLLATLEDARLQEVPCDPPTDDEATQQTVGITFFSLLSGCKASASISVLGVSMLGMGMALMKKTKKDE